MLIVECEPLGSQPRTRMCSCRNVNWLRINELQINRQNYRDYWFRSGLTEYRIAKEDHIFTAFTIGIFELVLVNGFYCDIKMDCTIKYSYKIRDMAPFKHAASTQFHLKLNWINYKWKRNHCWYWLYVLLMIELCIRWIFRLHVVHKSFNIEINLRNEI